MRGSARSRIPEDMPRSGMRTEAVLVWLIRAGKLPTPKRAFYPGNPRRTVTTRLETAAVADHADGQPLDREIVPPRIDLDRLEVGIFRQQLDRGAAPAQALDGHFVAEARDHDLSGAHVLRLV